MDTEQIIHDTNKVDEYRRKEEDKEQIYESISYVECNIGDKMHRRRYLVNFLVAMFGMAAPIPLNGLGAELPLLVKLAPEGSTLGSSLAIGVVAYMVPALYALLNGSSSRSKIRNEFTWITGILIFGLLGTAALAFFHTVAITIYGKPRSVVFIFLVFALSLVSGSRNVLLMPYLRHFKEAHLNSFFMGEALSGLIPSIVALVQGVGGDPLCSTNTTNATEPSTPLYVSEPNFSSKDFFLFVLALQALCVCAFWFLGYLRERSSQENEDGKFRREREYTEEHNSSKKLLKKGSAEKIREIEAMEDKDLTLSEPTIAPGHSLSNYERIWLFVLIWLVYCLSHGYLNTMEIYSSRPYGNSTHHLATNLSQLAGTLACALAFWLPPLRTRGVTGIMALVCIGTIYVTWLGLSSPMPIWRDTTHGVIHLIIIWVFLMSLVSYSRLAITAIIWQESNDASLSRLNFANLFGSMCSAGLIFYLVNFTALLTPYAPCVPQG